MPALRIAANVENSGAPFSCSQNMSLTPSWTSLGESALTTWPKAELVISPLTEAGPKNCAWLKVLNVSRRSCKARDSPKLIDFESAISKFSKPGP